MELLAGKCPKRVGDEFADDIDPFDSHEWLYGGCQTGSLRAHGGDDDDDALATLANLASPPQKLKPIRCGVKPPSDDRNPLEILAGTLERLPEIGFLGDGCFEAPSGPKIADVEEKGQLTRGLEMEFQGRNLTSWDGVPLSSSVDSDSDSSSPGIRKAVKGKRKRKTRKKLEHFLEKLVGSMMKRQEKMHNQLINVMEKIERERIHREDAWRQQEMQRLKQNEEARKQETAHSLTLISFIKNVIGEEIDMEIIPKPVDSPQQCEDVKGKSAQTKQRDAKFGYSASGRRWPQEEVQTLISARSQVEDKMGCHKGAIWDEISARMKERGYERSAKKCKEKWENMNKYYKRVNEGGKKQPEHSKTRPYFEKLANFYKTGNL